MKKIALFLVLTFLITALAGCAGVASDNIKSKEPEIMQDVNREYTDIAYGDLPDQKLDLFLPEGEGSSFPVVVFVHGGGWYAGDKHGGFTTVWRKLTESGYAVASVNYRLSNGAPHPAGIMDCKSAIRFLKAHAEEYRLDPDRFAVAGESSGGHYALMVAVTVGETAYDDPICAYSDLHADVRCCVAWYPAADLSAIWEMAGDASRWSGYGAGCARDNIARYLGKSIDSADDPLMAEASPINHITEDMSCILLQHGNADQLCPMEQTATFYEKAKDIVSEERVALDIFDGAVHGDSDFCTDENMERIREFLDAHMAATTDASAEKSDEVKEISYTTDSGDQGYIYASGKVLSGSEKRPLVLVMTYTSGNARAVVKGCGWDALAANEKLIVVSPEYNNYATYGETERLMRDIEYACAHYPVDRSRIYATGFSNGGAAAVAMVSRYPDVFAAISSMGWMVDMQGQDNSYDIPFQVIQGTREYTQTINGSPAVMDDERHAIRSLLLYNEMIDEAAAEDYQAAPYWGYVPDETLSGKAGGNSFTISNYYRQGFEAPYTQFILIDGAKHEMHSWEAETAWNFMKNYSLDK